MNADRFVINDTTWARISAHVPGKVSDRGVTGKDTDYFLKPSCGEFVQGRRGVTFPPLLAIGIPPSAGFGAGRARECLNVSSRDFRRNRILNT
jgi:hypothetical protein